jgi:hypothetical protein
MDKVLQCDCGFEARAEDEEGLVAEVRAHAWEVHGMALSHDEALLLTFRAQLSATAPDADPPKVDNSNRGAPPKHTHRRAGRTDNHAATDPTQHLAPDARTSGGSHASTS